MTQLFTYRGFSLRKAALHTRVLITAFLATTGLAIAVGFVNYRVRTGLAPSGAVLWYRGGEAAEAAGAAGAEGAEGGLLFEKTPLELLDATHPHLFGQAFLFFVLCHLFALTPVRPRLKMAVYVAAFGSVVVDAASPWLIRYVSTAFAWLQVGGTAVMAVVFLALVLVPLREMWWAGGRAPRTEATW